MRNLELFGGQHGAIASDLAATPLAGATFSPCRTWRYKLWRQVVTPPPPKVGKTLAVIGLNPSTADEVRDDPTIRRVIGYARLWGFERLVMLNLFAFRATDPRVMKAARNPVGPENDAALLAETSRRRVLVAWGAHGSFDDRSERVAKLLGDRDLVCLGTTASGEPKHPLYLPHDAQPVAWKGAARG